MGRRNGEVDAVLCSELPKKRIRTVSENINLKSDVHIERPLPPGEILTDVAQKQWKIGKPIGQGSFGEIYLASDNVDDEVDLQNSRYVIKIEPHSNGPLFVEIHCLIRSARYSKIEKWKKEKNMKSLGMPHYIANGSHLHNDTRYRFLVLPRYDCDVEKIISSSNTRVLSPKNVLTLAVQIIDILEYLHSQGYAHSDIKSSNLMVGFDGLSFKNPKKHDFPPSTLVKKSISKSKSKTRYSSYYYDEDFVLHNYLSSNSNTDCESEEDFFIEKPVRVRNAKAKNVGVKRLFNLRKIKSDVNYEDLNSSICSYDSYQDLIEPNGQNNLEEEIDHFRNSIQSQSSGQVYLLDYGLASKFLNSDGSHKEFIMDQRKAHDGTLEYSSRDSHIGAHSRRSDLENLGYNILDWLTGGLPWKSSEMLADPDLVHALKKNYMSDIKGFMEICFKTNTYPKYIEKYFSYLTTLKFEETPDYNYCKSLFVTEFISSRFGLSRTDMLLNFNNAIHTKSNIRYSKKFRNLSKNTSPDFLKRNAIVKVYGRENSQVNYLNVLKMDLIRESLSNDGVRKPCTSRNFFVSDVDLITKLRQTLLVNRDTPSKKFSPKVLRSKKIVKKKKGGGNAKSSIGKFGKFLGSDKQYTWAEILAGNPEQIMRKTEKVNNDIDLASKKPRSRKVSNASETSSIYEKMTTDGIENLLHGNCLKALNPTNAMKEVLENYRRKSLGLPLLKHKECERQDIAGYTPAMIEVISQMERRIKKEKLVEEKSAQKSRKNTDPTKSPRVLRNRKETTTLQENQKGKTKKSEPQIELKPKLKGKNAAKACISKNGKKLAKTNNTDECNEQKNNKTTRDRRKNAKTEKGKSEKVSTVNVRNTRSRGKCV